MVSNSSKTKFKFVHVLALVSQRFILEYCLKLVQIFYLIHIVYIRCKRYNCIFFSLSKNLPFYSQAQSWQLLSVEQKWICHMVALLAKRLFLAILKLTSISVRSNHCKFVIYRSTMELGEGERGRYENVVHLS